MKRGEIWEADLGGRAGKRPVLILTRSGVIPYLNNVVIAEVTTKCKGYPTQIPIGQSANLPKPSWVSAECLHMIAKDRLRRYLGTLPSSLLRDVNHAIIFALALNDA